MYSSLVTQFSPVVEVLLFTRAQDLERVLNSSSVDVAWSVKSSLLAR